jgi:GDP-L-fucose synthase
MSITTAGLDLAKIVHVDDLARACLFLMDSDDSPEIINVGTGEDLSIAELASLVGEAVGYSGAVAFDSSRPDDTLRERLDVTRLTQLGWRARDHSRRGRSPDLRVVRAASER